MTEFNINFNYNHLIRLICNLVSEIITFSLHLHFLLLFFIWTLLFIIFIINLYLADSESHHVNLSGTGVTGEWKM